MPSNKTSLYDGQVHILNSTLDLTGKQALVNNGSNIAMGDTVIGYDNGDVSLSAGDELYGSEPTGSGRIKHIGTIDSVTESGSAGSFAGNITLTSGSKIALADDTFLMKDLPKFEIAAIQVVIAGTLTNLIPAENRFPRTIQADGVTSFDDTHEVNYYGATDGSAGAAVSGVIDAGITIEGRFKKVTISSGDSAICHLKAVAYRGLKDMP